MEACLAYGSFLTLWYFSTLIPNCNAPTIFKLMPPNNSNRHIPSLRMCCWITLVSNGLNLHGTLLHSWITIGLVIVDYAKPNRCSDCIVNSLLWGSFWSWMFPFNNSNLMWKAWKSNQHSWVIGFFFTCPSIISLTIHFYHKCICQNISTDLETLIWFFHHLLIVIHDLLKHPAYIRLKPPNLKIPSTKKSRVGIRTRRWGIYLFFCFPKANALDFTCVTMLITRAFNILN